MKKGIIGAVAAVAALAGPTAALADTGGVSGGPGYSPPPAVSDFQGPQCDAAHGAFGAFGGKYDNLGINDLGTNGAPGAANPHNPGAGGQTTGGANSDYSAYCQTQ